LRLLFIQSLQPILPIIPEYTLQKELERKRAEDERIRQMEEEKAKIQQDLTAVNSKMQQLEQQLQLQNRQLEQEQTERIRLEQQFQENLQEKMGLETELKQRISKKDDSAIAIERLYNYALELKEQLEKTSNEKENLEKQLSTIQSEKRRSITSRVEQLQSQQTFASIVEEEPKQPPKMNFKTAVGKRLAEDFISIQTAKKPKLSHEELCKRVQDVFWALCRLMEEPDKKQLFQQVTYTRSIFYSHQ